MNHTVILWLVLLGGVVVTALAWVFVVEPISQTIAKIAECHT